MLRLLSPRLDQFRGPSWRCPETSSGELGRPQGASVRVDAAAVFLLLLLLLVFFACQGHRLPRSLLGGQSGDRSITRASEQTAERTSFLGVERRPSPLETLPHCKSQCVPFAGHRSPPPRFALFSVSPVRQARYPSVVHSSSLLANSKLEPQSSRQQLRSAPRCQIAAVT